MATSSRGGQRLEALGIKVVALEPRTPADVQRITYLIWTCHNLERIADRVTNICERVIFMVTGQLEEINVSRY